MLGEQAADRVDVLILQVDTENLAELVDAQAGRKAERAVLVERVLGAFVIVLVGDIAHELLDEVLQGNQTGGSAVLVHDHGHVGRFALHIAQQVHGALRLGFESGRAHDFHQCRHGGTLGGLGVQNVGAHRILEVENTQDLVARIANHRHAGVARTQEQAQRLAQRHVATHGEHIGAGHHERADAQVVHLEHGLHHLRLVVLDGLGVGGALQELA